MNLKITTIQSELHWENAAKNLAMFSEKIASIKEAIDVIVLPEMFTTGFTMNAKTLAETMEGQTVAWMKQQAKNKNAVIVGGLIITENNLFFNRLIWAQPDGKIHTYDKRHLFRMANEHEFYSSGNSRLVVEWKGWKICPLICYDLRFLFGAETNPSLTTHHTPPITHLLHTIASFTLPTGPKQEKLLGINCWKHEL
jgi:omega-amidase